MRSIKFEFRKFSEVEIELPLSKSISNRLQILQSLWPGQLSIKTLSSAEDSLILERNLNSNVKKIDCGMAGTAYRFLTAFFAIKKGSQIILNGAERMRERPIGILVEALRALGADISYLGKEGYPPLLICGKELRGGSVEIDSSVSSQFITALLLIAGKFQNGLTLKLKGEESSAPYTDMTIYLLQEMGLTVKRVEERAIQFAPLTAPPKAKTLSVEADWSSAAFFYQLLLFHPTLKKLQLNGLQVNSIQGDVKVAQYFKHFGIETQENQRGVRVTQEHSSIQKKLNFDLSNEPDLAPSLILSAAFFSKKSTFTGIKSLRIKESDRIAALKNELAKLGILLTNVSDDEVQIERKEQEKPKLELAFNSYQDHRIAMALAPVAYLFNAIELDDPTVVSKSFPDYWQQAAKCGLVLN